MAVVLVFETHSSSLSPGWLRTELITLVDFEFTALLPTSPSVTVSFLWQ